MGLVMGRLSAELKGFASAVDQVYQSPVFKTSDIAKGRPRSDWPGITM